MEQLHTRARLLKAIRSFFEERGSLEVETPALVLSPGVDAHLDAIPAEGGYLTTSPEYHMKRLLAAGSGPIHQIAKAWRAGEVGAVHEPEFTLLEWYRPELTDHGLMEETEELIKVAARALSAPVGWLDTPFERITYRQAFLTHAGLDTANDEDRRFGLTLRAAGTKPPRDANREELEDLVFCQVVQPRLGQGVPSFVIDWPAGRAALARLQPGGQTAARFELFIEGLELCNGYHELLCPREQRQRIATENQRRATLGKTPYPVDEAFLAALESGLPDCAGNALGVDRLLMALTGCSTIEQVRAFRIELDPPEQPS